MKVSRVFLIIFVTFMFVTLFMPVVKIIAKHIGAIDMPNARKVHKKAIPRLGGLGIYFGFLLGFVLFGHQSVQMNSILIGSFIIVITGIIDDIKPIPAKYKLIGQIIGASVIPVVGGIALRDVSAFGIYINFGFLSYLVTIIFIVAIINCINLIDGLDGLAGGLAAIYFAMIGVIAILFNNSSGLDTILTFVMLGCTLGFLVHNFYPATIFMGDSGSMFLGYIIAVIALLGYKNVTFTSLIVPIFMLAIPIMDTLFAIIRRFLKGESISKGDSYHIHHQLLRRNLSVKQTVLIIYLVDILFASASIIYILKDKYLGYIIYGILLALVIVFVINTNVIYDFKDSSKEKKHE